MDVCSTQMLMVLGEKHLLENEKPLTQFLKKVTKIPSILKWEEKESSLEKNVWK